MQLSKHFVFMIFLLLNSLAFGNELVIKRGNNNSFATATIQTEHFQILAYKGRMSPQHGLNPLQSTLDAIQKNKPVLFWAIDSTGGFGNAYINFMDKLKEKSGYVSFYVTNVCASACASWAAMANTTNMVGGDWGLVLHKTWVLHSSISIKSPRQMAQKYGKLGANEEWFLQNLHVLNKEDNEGYFLNGNEAIESGLTDNIISVDEFKNSIGLSVYTAIIQNL